MGIILKLLAWIAAGVAVWVIWRHQPGDDFAPIAVIFCVANLIGFVSLGIRMLSPVTPSGAEDDQDPGFT